MRSEDLDLETARVIRAPRARVWDAWANPVQLAKWWIPKPIVCRIVDFELRPGGAFITEMSEDGPFVPHMSACFLDVVPEERIVFTNLLKGDWRPASRGFMTAIISLKDHTDGTAYTARAMHKDRSDRDRHEKMGFHDGWSTVVSQLAELVE